MLVPTAASPEASLGDGSVPGRWGRQVRMKGMSSAFKALAFLLTGDARPRWS